MADMFNIWKSNKIEFLRFKIDQLREIINRNIKQGILKKLQTKADSFFLCVLCGYFHKRG